MSSQKLSEDLEERKVTLRGTTYVIRELTADQYDSIMELVGEDAMLAPLLKLMAIEAIVSPKQTPESLGRKSFKVYNELLRIIRELHFGEFVYDTEEDAKVPND